MLVQGLSHTNFSKDLENERCILQTGGTLLAPHHSHTPNTAPTIATLCLGLEYSQCPSDWEGSIRNHLLGEVTFDVQPPHSQVPRVPSAASSSRQTGTGHLWASFPEGGTRGGIFLYTPNSCYVRLAYILCSVNVCQINEKC